jgi:hypothetical protein
MAVQHGSASSDRRHFPGTSRARVREVGRLYQSRPSGGANSRRRYGSVGTPRLRRKSFEHPLQHGSASVLRLFLPGRRRRRLDEMAGGRQLVEARTAVELLVLFSTPPQLAPKITKCHRREHTPLSTRRPPNRQIGFPPRATRASRSHSQPQRIRSDCSRRDTKRSPVTITARRGGRRRRRDEWRNDCQSKRVRPRRTSR